MHTVTPDPSTVQFKTSLNVPDDNDKPTAALLESMIGTLLGNTAWLKWRGVADVQITTNVIGAHVDGQANVWQNFPSGGGFTPYIQFGTTMPGDILLCLAVGQWFVTKDAAIISPYMAASIRLNSVQDLGGTPTEYAVTGAQAVIDATDLERAQDVTLFGRVVITNGGATRVYFQGRNQDSDPDYTVKIAAGRTFTLGGMLIRPHA